MKRINILLSIALIIMLGFTITSCKDDSTTSYPYNVRMTDAVGPYDAVYVDIQGVEIKGSDGKAVLMNVNSGIYNLLDFSNGKDTLISNGTLENSKVEQIRLILGSNNSVVVNGIIYPLSTPSADQSGLKLQVHQILQAGIQYSVLLDFDANKSIVSEGNGNYKLKPVIRTIEAAISGAIKGKITPIGTLASVTATSSNITYSSNVSVTGDFLIMGLPSGTYSVTVTPESPLIPFTQTGIVVTTGITNFIGIIAF